MVNPQKADLEQRKTLTLRRLLSRETVDAVNLKKNWTLEPISPEAGGSMLCSDAVRWLEAVGAARDAQGLLGRLRQKQRTIQA